MISKLDCNLIYRTWENFGRGKFWRTNGSKVIGEEIFGESVGSLLKTPSIYKYWWENFGELPTVRQICQNFPPPKFSHVRYQSILLPSSHLIIYFNCTTHDCYHFALLTASRMLSAWHNLYLAAIWYLTLLFAIMPIVSTLLDCTFFSSL